MRRKRERTKRSEEIKKMKTGELTMETGASPAAAEVGEIARPVPAAIGKCVLTRFGERRYLA